MALISSEQACVITGSKLAPQTHKVPVYCICVTWLWSYKQQHTLQTRAPLLDTIDSMSSTMNVNFIFMILHITLCISVVPTLCSVEPAACAKAILGIL